MKVIQYFKDRALARRTAAFEEFLKLSRMASRGEITLPDNTKVPVLKPTRQVEKLNRQIKEMNGL